MRKETCQILSLNGNTLPQAENIKYLVSEPKTKMNKTLNQLISPKFQLTIENKVLMYKAIWSYDVQLWDFARILNIEILQKQNSHPKASIFCRARGSLNLNFRFTYFSKILIVNFVN